MRYILFIPVSVPLYKLATVWSEDCDGITLHQCPVCKRDSIVGHGRRRKHAHDEHHDWIWIHRGRCPDCGTTFTFLPLLSLPYTHYNHPKTSLTPLRTGLDGLIYSLLATQHLILVLRRSIPNGPARTHLNRLANRLTKILAAIQSLQTL